MLCFLWGKKKGSNMLNLNFFIICFFFYFPKPWEIIFIKKNILNTLSTKSHIWHSLENKVMIYTISDRDGFHHLLNDVLLIQPKTHQQGFGVVSLVEGLSHTSWRYLSLQLKRIKHQTLVQRVNKQTFRCSGCPRPAWGKKKEKNVE